LSESVEQDFPWSDFSDLQPYEIPVRDEPLPDDPLYLAETQPDAVMKIPARRGGGYTLCIKP
jgi:hypothetical protein